MTDSPTGADGPDVDIVILTWNDGELLDAAIASCQDPAETPDPPVQARVIVVDNGSEPPARVDDGVHLVRNPTNVGVAAGRNQGIAAGTAPLVCLLDSDAVLRPGTLARLVAELERSEATMVVPVFEDQPPEASAGLAPGPVRKLTRVLGRTAVYDAEPRPQRAASWPVEFGIGACQLFRREAWEAIGGIDEVFFYGPEDVDFCLRLIEAGGTVRQVADTPVLHPPRRRHRKPVDLAGLRHGAAIGRYLLRHRWVLTRGS